MSYETMTFSIIVIDYAYDNESTKFELLLLMNV